MNGQTTAPALSADWPADWPVDWPVDWEALLAPVGGGDACGQSLRYEGTYDQIRRARQCDDETLAQGVWETTPKRADWAAASALCAAALETRSKDLQLAAWLLEAWIHLHGFGGAAAGLALIHGLCVRYWPDLHPRPEAGDNEFRYSAIAWINEKLATDLKLVPLTSPQGAGDAAACSWADWEKAQHLVHAGARSREMEETAAEARAQFQKSLQQTPVGWLSKQREHVREIVASTRAIESVLDAAAGPDCPGLVGLRRVAEAIDSFLGTVISRRAPEASAALESAAGGGAADGRDLGGVEENAAAAAIPAGPIRSREHAYLMLSAVADYLRATEPHSPVPYLVERAVVWGGMRLADLLPELVRDRDHLDEIHRLLRIGPATPAGPASG
ncbi:MAG: type VI secretion system protein TssA [Bryobacteraceae bacterium]